MFINNYPLCACDKIWHGGGNLVWTWSLSSERVRYQRTAAMHAFPWPFAWENCVTKDAENRPIQTHA